MATWGGSRSTRWPVSSENEDAARENPMLITSVKASLCSGLSIVSLQHRRALITCSTERVAATSTSYKSGLGPAACWRSVHTRSQPRGKSLGARRTRRTSRREIEPALQGSHPGHVIAARRQHDDRDSAVLGIVTEKLENFKLAIGPYSPCRVSAICQARPPPPLGQSASTAELGTFSHILARVPRARRNSRYSWAWSTSTPGSVRSTASSR